MTRMLRIQIVPKLFTGLYILAVLACWLWSTQSVEALTLPGIILIILLAPWIILWIAIMDGLDPNLIDQPLWSGVAILVSASLNASLIYAFFCLSGQLVAYAFGWIVPEKPTNPENPDVYRPPVG